MYNKSDELVTPHQLTEEEKDFIRELAIHASSTRDLNTIEEEEKRRSIFHKLGIRPISQDVGSEEWEKMKKSK